VIAIIGCRSAAAPAPVPAAAVAARAPLAAPVPSPRAPVDIDQKDESGWTALQRAAEGGDLKEIEALLAQGASLEASSPGVYGGATAFEIALEFSQPEAAKLLLDRGASIAGAIGTQALALAARDGDDAILDALLARGVVVTSTGALALAAKFDRVSTIAKLIKAGAAVNAADADDHHFTPLMVACMEGKLEAARALLAAGARIDAQDDERSTALHWAVFASRPVEIHMYEDLGKPHTTIFRPRPDAPVVKLLITHGAKLDLADGDANTPLHEAALMDARAAAELLVAAGANRALRNRDGKTALDLARARKNSVEDVLGPRAGIPKRP
jgi:ankyrin repeat protein